MKQITNYFAPIQKAMIPGGEMRFLTTTKLPPNTSKTNKTVEDSNTNEITFKNPIENTLVTPKKMGGGRKKPIFNNLVLRNPLPPEKIGPVPARKTVPCWFRNLSNRSPDTETDPTASTSHLTVNSKLSPKQEMEEDWGGGTEEKGGKKGKKRGRSKENEEEENLLDPKKVKRGKPYENLKSLHVARTGVRVRLESESTEKPSSASICHKIDLGKLKVIKKNQKNLNGEGINLLLEN